MLLAHHLFLILEGQTKENLLSIFNTSLISSSIVVMLGVDKGVTVQMKSSFK